LFFNFYGGKLVSLRVYYTEQALPETLASALQKRYGKGETKTGSGGAADINYRNYEPAANARLGYGGNDGTFIHYRWQMEYNRIVEAGKAAGKSEYGTGISGASRENPRWVKLSGAPETGGSSKDISGEAVTEADFTVELTTDGTGAVITGYKGKAARVRIPETIQGMPVQIIRQGAFAGKSITAVTIPAGLVIGPEAFKNCTNLTTVDMGLPLLSSIGRSAFSDCTRLQNINIPEGVTTIESTAFFGCVSLKAIDFPQSLRIILMAVAFSRR
jgi:hypothetical protein